MPLGQRTEISIQRTGVAQSRFTPPVAPSTTTRPRAVDVIGGGLTRPVKRSWPRMTRTSDMRLSPPNNARHASTVLLRLAKSNRSG
jgi:hypothetical protein